MKRLKNISEIDTNRAEGRLLLAALAILTTSPSVVLFGKEVKGTAMEPDEMLEKVYLFQEEMHSGMPDIPVSEATQGRPTFQKSLEILLNNYSMERTGGNTPDYMLAEYLTMCLTAFGKVVNERQEWYSIKK